VITVILASLPLIAGIAAAAKTRHLGNNIDGSVPELGSVLDIILRYVSNTTEQTVLFILACYCLKIMAPMISVKMLPILGSWFVIARLIFYIGYRINPLARSVGFAATFHMTIAMFLYVLIKLFE
jgi:uncharacterized membrane protein YecN with MAPEG domain